MHCAIVPTALLTGTGLVALGEAESHHLRDVLRARPGDAVRLVDGRGSAREAAVAAVTRREVSVELRGGVLTPPPPAARVTLFQCVAKPARMDWLLEKAAELGAARIVPILSARTVARLRPGETPERWRRILDAALCQCNAAWGTELEPAVDWPGALERMRALGGPLFVGSLAPGALPMGEALLARRDALRAGPVGWLVGPEGDFAPDELASALALPGAVPVTLGNRVLRVETAAVFGLSSLLSLAL